MYKKIKQAIKSKLRKRKIRKEKDKEWRKFERWITEIEMK